MYQYKGINDTICAIATPSGAGGLAVVRLSGHDALKVASVLFCAKSGKPAEGWPTFTVRFGTVVEPVSGDVVDEVLATLMRAPKSYTCEDVVEISCHGGTVAARAIVELCIKNGARLAEPGEFTKRAFLNGRIDLAQAEAVLDVINARTSAALRASEGQLKGELSCEIDGIRAAIMGVFTGIEALLNFPEEGTEEGQAARLRAELEAALLRVDALLSTAQAGRVLREGIRIVICGKPNVGKSSLLNCLLRQPRAIVTDVAGTTRDVLEETANIRGIPVNLVDTAGILEPRDKVEAEAVKRSHASIETADLVLLVLDHSAALEAVDLELIKRAQGAHTVVVLNKSDKVAAFDPRDLVKSFSVDKVVAVSAVTGDGIVALENLLAVLSSGGVSFETNRVLVNNLRHVEALGRAHEFLTHAVKATAEKVPFEMVSEDIKGAVNCLDAITGRDVDADLIDQIFARFCIGK